MQKIVYVKPEINGGYEEPALINKLLSSGWKVVSITPQQVSISVTGSNFSERERLGSFLVVLEDR
jgi:hypothetical protein